MPADKQVGEAGIRAVVNERGAIEARYVESCGSGYRDWGAVIPLILTP